MARIKIKDVRLNLLGVLAILIGLASFAAPFVPPLAGVGFLIGAAGVAIGFLALLISLKSPRYGSGVPVIGLLVSLGAAGLAASQSGMLPWMPNTKKETPPATPGTTAHSPSAVPSASPGSDHANEPEKPKSLFGDVGGTASSADDRNANRSPSTPGAGVPIHSSAAGPSLDAARAKLRMAKAAVDQSLAHDPEYQAAKAAVDAAERDAANGGADSSATAKLLARTKLRKIVDAAEAKNRAYQDALRDVASAEGRGTK